LPQLSRITDATFIERLDNCLLTTSDVDQAVNSKPVRPSRWADYIRKEERSKETNGQLLAEFPSIMPYSIIDHRGRVMRPALCSAFHGWCQGLTPVSKAATI